MAEITTLNVQFTPGAVASTGTMNLVKEKINELVRENNQDQARLEQTETNKADITSLKTKVSTAEADIRELKAQVKAVYITQEEWDLLEKSGTWLPDTEYNILE